MKCRVELASLVLSSTEEGTVCIESKDGTWRREVDTEELQDALLRVVQCPRYYYPGHARFRGVDHGDAPPRAIGGVDHEVVFKDVAVAPHTKVTLGAPVKRVFRGHSFHVDAEIDVHAFVVHDFRVGVRSLVASNAPIPLAALVGPVTAFCLDDAHPGLLLALDVENTTDKPQAIEVKLKGKAL